MNFIAVYIGHRCTLWFYKFTLNKYFGSSESFTKRIWSWKGLLLIPVPPSAFVCECLCQKAPLSLLMPLFQGVLLATWCQAFGGVGTLLGLPGLVSVSGSPMHPGLRLGAFLALLPCSPRQPDSACFCGKLGQETVLPLWLVAELCFHWYGLWSPRGSSSSWGSRSFPGCRVRWILLLPFLQ